MILRVSLHPMNQLCIYCHNGMHNIHIHMLWTELLIYCIINLCYVCVQLMKMTP